jgi:hypothetical protein
MDTNKDMQELEQMRQQMDILKQKLDRQEIVNDQIIRQSMKSRMSWINKYRWIALLTIPFVAVCFLPAVCAPTSVFGGFMTWPLYIFTILIVAASTIADFIINRISDNTMMNSSLLEISEKLTKMKRLRRIQTIIGLIVIVIWLAWLMYEIYASAGDDPDTKRHTIGFMIAVGVGAIIGGAIGLSIFFKMQRTNDDVIRQIEELKKIEEQNGQTI